MVLFSLSLLINPWQEQENSRKIIQRRNYEVNTETKIKQECLSVEGPHAACQENMQCDIGMNLALR